MREYVAILCCNQEVEPKILQILAEKKVKPLYKFSFITIPYKKFLELNEGVPDVIVTVVDTGEKLEEVVKDCISEFYFYEKSFEKEVK